MHLERLERRHRVLVTGKGESRAVVFVCKCVLPTSRVALKTSLGPDLGQFHVVNRARNTRLVQ